jgi:hypothetical protein
VRYAALFLALVVGGQASAQDATCAELLDGGVPGPAVKVLPGHVVEESAWLVPPARMCLVGERLAACDPSPPLVPVKVLVLTGAAGVVVGAAIALVVAGATGHLR